MRIGILGAGQLGRMLALAGYPLGLRFRFMDSAPGGPAPRAVSGHPAADVGEVVEASFTDGRALAAFADGLDAVTYEFENVPVEAARSLEQRLPVFPPSAALACAQDRLNEKSLFARLGIPTPEFFNIASLRDLSVSAAATGMPCVLKTRRGGYDGKGQFVLRTPDDAEHAWRTLGAGEVPLILESFVRFDRELSILAVRSRTGQTAFYPLVQNEHAAGILRLSIAPAPDLSRTLQEQAERHATAVMEELGYTGVLAIEFFEVGGRLLANEMAPRVHNSGHWSIEGAVTSQFENHLRAGLGWPLGSTAPLGCSAMINLIGSAPGAPEVLAIPDAHYHWYGKSARPGRKLGHITVCAADHATLSARTAAIQSTLGHDA